MASRSPLIGLVVAVGSLSMVSCPLLEWGGVPGPIGTARAETQPVPSATASGAAEVRLEEEPEVADSPEANPGSWPEPSDDDLTALHADTRSVAVDPNRALASIAPETIIRSQPSFEAAKLGYLRAGAVVRRDPDPASHHHCAQGWYRIEPRGYVCVGRTATLDTHHPIVVASSQRPDRNAGLPYAYGRSLFPTPPFYTKIPTAPEQERAEYDLSRHRKFSKRAAWDHVTIAPVPEQLRDGKAAPSLHGYQYSPRTLFRGYAIPDSGFAFHRFFEFEGRRYGLTTDLAILPLDRLKPVTASGFRGLPLDGEITLPVVFIRSHRGNLYRFEADQPGKSLHVDRKLEFREAIPITGKTVRIRGKEYLETRDGGLVRNVNLVRVNPMRNRPSWATPGRTWVDVSILKQVLIAYEGTKPVYVTLVSTGADGLGDPKETHSTVRGRFLIHTKHVTATMSGDEEGDAFDLRDVPYVQYFTEGYALHAAYWHDAFGMPRSHGCINLSPLDAHWLFGWTDPQVPDEWHAGMSLHQGTLVSVHP